jgi:diacylglycerol kinase (ATP)
MISEKEKRAGEEKEQIVFIINPVSGKGKSKDTAETISKELDIDRFSPLFFFTKKAGDATQFAKDSEKKGVRYIVAVGGDGTMNEVASALINTNAFLGIIPSGSGNGFARHLHIPSNKQKAISIINKLHTLTIDYGTINNQPFFCTCGVGFDARIGHLFALNPKRGFNAYIKATFQEFLQYKPKKYTVKINNKKIRERAFLITVANASQYGNNAYIAPHADITDGMLDVSIVKPFPIHRAINFGLSLFNKQIEREPYVEVCLTKKLTIKRKKEGEVHIDGEPVMMGKKLKIHIVPKGLQVIIPLEKTAGKKRIIQKHLLK